MLMPACFGCVAADSAMPASTGTLQEPPPRALQPPQARQPQTVVEHNHSKQGPEAQQLMFEVLQNLGSVAPQRDHDVTEPAGQDGHRRRLAWEAAQRQQAHRQATLKQARRGAPSGSQQVHPKQQAGKPEQTGLLCRVPSGGAAAAPAAGRGSPGLEGLREAAWRAAEDPKLAADAMMTAWVSCAAACSEAEAVPWSPLVVAGAVVS